MRRLLPCGICSSYCSISKSWPRAGSHRCWLDESYGTTGNTEAGKWRAGLAPGQGNPMTSRFVNRKRKAGRSRLPLPLPVKAGREQSAGLINPPDQLLAAACQIRQVARAFSLPNPCHLPGRLGPGGTRAFSW